MQKLLAIALVLVGCGAANEATVTGGGSSEDGGQNSAGDGGGPASMGMDAGAPHDASTGVDAGPSDAGMLPAMSHQAFLVGYNEGWIGSYGSDLTSGFDITYVRKILDGINKAGGHIMRLWLFELNQGVTLGASAPQSSSLSPQMIANVESVLVEARARGIWVYLTGLNGNDMLQAASPTRDYYYNLLNNKYGEGDAFNTYVLTPMLAMMGKHQDVIYGFDIVNEIEAAQQHAFWPDVYNGARGFIQREAAFIHGKSPWLKVTSSAGFSTSQFDISNGMFSGLGLDFYDLHVYADNGSYLGASDVCTRAQTDGVPVILGEFGQMTMNDDDTLQQNTTQGFLSGSKSLCFKGALGWRFDSAEATWRYVRADGTFRPAVTVMQTYGVMP